MKFFVAAIAVLAFLFCAGLLSVSSTGTTALPLPQYTITDLGSLGGLITNAASINNIGQIVGSSQSLKTDDVHAFLWQRGTMTDLGTLPGDQRSEAFSINDAGQIAGVSTRDGKSNHAVLWDHGHLSDLGLIGNDEARTGAVSRISNGGQMIVNIGILPDGSLGTALKALTRPSLEHHQVLLCTRSGVSHAQALGDEIVSAVAINDNRNVVGQRMVGSPYHLRAYLWKNGTMTDLGAFQPTGMNNNGQVVGLQISGHPFRATAVLWQNGIVTPLPSPDAQTLARAINDHGDVVGCALPPPSHNPFPDNAAVLLWSGGRCINLGQCLNPRSGWKLLDVAAINSRGQIIGYGRHNGKIAAFVMTPLTTSP